MHFYCLTLVVVLLFVGISMVSMAEVAVLQIEISDVVSNRDAHQIRRLLEPWADAKDITFEIPVDKNGRKRIFSTLVKIKPRQGVSKYSETPYVLMSMTSCVNSTTRVSVADMGLGFLASLKAKRPFGVIYSHIQASLGVISETCRRGDAGDRIPRISITQ